MKKFLIGETLENLENLFVENNFERYRAKQVLEGIFKNKDVENLNIPQQIKLFLNNNFLINQTQIYKVFESKKSSTKKFLFKLFDNQLVEGVFMEYSHGNSFCVSTQVGCKMGCVFCASGKNGFLRNIFAGEMVEFLMLAQNYLNKKINNIVLMGSGEPLDNFDEVCKFLNVICPINKNNFGFNISNRNIALSTCGIVPKILKLCEIPQKITLSISLHATLDEARKKIMKIANTYKIKDIIDAARTYYNATLRKIEIEYTLINKVNDSFLDAKRLSNLLSGLNAHVNLINLNDTQTNLKATPKKQVYAFCDKLNELGVNATVRRVLGDDVGGACGQLRGRELNKIDKN